MLSELNTQRCAEKAKYRRLLAEHMGRCVRMQRMGEYREVAQRLREFDQQLVGQIASASHPTQREILDKCGVSMKHIAWLGATKPL